MTRSRLWLLIALYALPALTMGALWLLWRQQLIGEPALLILSVITIVSFLYVAFKLLWLEQQRKRQ